MVRTLPELKYALECVGMNEEKIIKFLSHENAHANKTQELGGNFLGYSIIQYERSTVGSKKSGYMVVTEIDDFPEDWSKEQRRKAFVEIALAPEDYESDHPLSANDHTVIHDFSDKPTDDSENSDDGGGFAG